MSKQERTGAWAIVTVIVLIFVAMMIERRCTSNVEVKPGSEKELNEYIEKAGKSKPEDSGKKTTKTKKQSRSKEGSKDEAPSKATNKKGKKKSKKQASKQGSKSSASRKIEPLPQF